MKKFITALLISTLLTSEAYSAQGRQFFMSVIYGTLAGTLVGAATLAFTSNPGDNLNNVARGASYGMYAGILLGLYVTYLVDDEPANPNAAYPKEGVYFSLTPSLSPEIYDGKKEIQIKSNIITYRF